MPALTLNVSNLLNIVAKQSNLVGVLHQAILKMWIVK